MLAFLPWLIYGVKNAVKTQKSRSVHRTLPQAINTVWIVSLVGQKVSEQNTSKLSLGV